MKRIAFLRSIEIQQTEPYIHALGAALQAMDAHGKLFYTDGHCFAGDFPGDAEKLDPSSSCDEIVSRLLDWRADGVISLSIPDENSLRDFIVREKLARYGIPMVMHGPDTTCLLANKWQTKQAVVHHGLETPRGMLVDGDILNSRSLPVPAYFDFLVRKAGEFGYPLLIKPLWDCLGNGIRYLQNESDLLQFFRIPYDGNFVLEQCITGELCSVEIIGCDGSYVIQPLIWKGQTGGRPFFAFDQVRYAAPRRVIDAQFAPVARRLGSLCADLAINGVIEVEMIYCDGAFHVIEINPRVSGTTTLSSAASGWNTYECLVDILFSRWPKQEAGTQLSPRRISVQLPVRSDAPALIESVEKELSLVRASTFHIEGKPHTTMVLTCTFEEGRSIGAKLESLCRRHDFLDPVILDRIEDVMMAANEVEAPAASGAIASGASGELE